MKKVLLIFLLASQSAVADYINNDIIAGCDAVYVYRAVFTPKTLACSSGNYLPANSLTCEKCPSGYTCNGGTYDFNADNFSGATYVSTITNNLNNICASNAPKTFMAVFAPKTIICNAGQYINANSIECNQTCPSNHYCPGGNFLFSENENVGIYPCASGTYSPSGSAVCYPHILHIGDNNVYLKSTKQTTPSLNIKIGNDIFYAHMTTVPTKMNKDSARYFRVQWLNNDYYVCDDTTCPQ